MGCSCAKSSSKEKDGLGAQAVPTTVAPSSASPPRSPTSDCPGLSDNPKPPHVADAKAVEQSDQPLSHDVLRACDIGAGQAASDPNDDDAAVAKLETAVDYVAEADAILKEAQKLLRQATLVLEAEAVLAKALARFETPDACTQRSQAARLVRESQVFLEVMRRLEQYESISEILRPTTYVLLWEKEDACLWIHAPPGQTWFEYKIAGYLNASLCHLMVTLNELDLQTRYQPMLVGPPVHLGRHDRNCLVTHSLISLLLFRVELIVQVERFVDKSFGFLGERVRSNFPDEDVPMPTRHWRNKRVSADSKQLVVPCGGGQPGLIFIQATRVEPGFQVPEFVLNYFCNKLALDYVENLRKCAKLVMEPGNPWAERLAADADGLYADLALADAAADKRPPIAMGSLPGREIFERPWKLSQVAAGLLSSSSPSQALSGLSTSISL